VFSLQNPTAAVIDEKIAAAADLSKTKLSVFWFCGTVLAVLGNRSSR